MNSNMSNKKKKKKSRKKKKTPSSSSSTTTTTECENKKRYKKQRFTRTHRIADKIPRRTDHRSRVHVRSTDKSNVWVLHENVFERCGVWEEWGLYDVARDIADIRRVIGRLVCDDLGTIRKSRGVTLDRVWSRERDVDDGFVERDE